MALKNPPVSLSGDRGFIFSDMYNYSDSGRSLISLFFLSISVFLFISLQPAQAAKVDLPNWFLQGGDAQNEVTAMGETKLKALLNGLGSLTENLDPNVEKLREAYGNKLTQKSTRLLSRYQFGKLKVATQTEIYRKVTSTDETRTFQQKIVRVCFPAADTTCKVFYYVEELHGDISSVCEVRPDTFSKKKILKILRELFKQAGLQVKRLESTDCRCYALIQYAALKEE